MSAVGVPTEFLYKKNHHGTASWLAVLLNVASLSVGTTAGSIVSTMYFTIGGSRIWFSGFLQTVGFPLALPVIVYFYRNNPDKFHHIDSTLFFLSAGIGVLTGMDVFIYSWGLSYLPMSTSLVLISTQLGFIAFFGYLLVRQPLTAYSVNTVTVLTLGCTMLVATGDNSKPEGVSSTQFHLGFVLSIGGAALFGMMVPMVELSLRFGRREVTYVVLLEMQMVMSAWATVFLLVGSVASGEMKDIAVEARSVDGGLGAYVAWCVAAAVVWQLYYLGVYGVTFQFGSLMAGVVVSAWIPPTAVATTLIFNMRLTGPLAISVVMAAWGVISCVFGEYKECCKSKGVAEQAHPPDSCSSQSCPEVSLSIGGQRSSM